MANRRQLLGLGGALAALALLPSHGRAAGVLDIEMRGRSDGSHVWFDPVGIRISPGARVRWINRDKGNSHTTTAYHPANFDRPRRIPRDAEPWDSDYLIPDESFEREFLVPGVYDYYCVPHEHAGMVGRIVVGQPGDWMSDGNPDDGLPQAALEGFPSVDDIMKHGVVRRT